MILKRILLCLIAFISFLPPASAAASERPPVTLEIRGSKLVLNGFGVRERLWLDVYRCALYLPKPSSVIRFINDPATAKAIRIRIVSSGIPDQIPRDWRDVFAEELSKELLQKLKEKYKGLTEHDTLVFAYSPGVGTEIWINGQPLLSDPGHELMLEMLQQWVGDKPVSRNLKRSLLNSVP